jgi:hypothetical protein
MKDSSKKKQQLIDELVAARRDGEQVRLTNEELQEKIAALQGLLAERAAVSDTALTLPAWFDELHETPGQVQRLVSDMAVVRDQVADIRWQLEEVTKVILASEGDEERDPEPQPKQQSSPSSEPASRPAREIPKIEAILQEMGFLDEQGLEQALELQREQAPHRPLSQVLLSSGVITRDQLRTATMRRLDLLKLHLQRR